MLIESCQIRKASRAKITSETASTRVPCDTRGSRGTVVIRVKSIILNQTICEEVIAVHLAAVLIDFLTVNA